MIQRFQEMKSLHSIHLFRMSESEFGRPLADLGCKFSPIAFDGLSQITTELQNSTRTNKIFTVKSHYIRILREAKNMKYVNIHFNFASAAVN